MTADEIKNKLFSGSKPSNDSEKTEEQKKLCEQNANELASVLARLDTALSKNNFGGLKILSGYRSTASQRNMYNKRSNGGKTKPNPATAKPGTSAHEWGSAVDCRSKSGTFDDFIKFTAKWIITNGIKFDQIIDESGSSSEKNGWCHIGLTHLGKKTGIRNKIYIMWGTYHSPAYASVNDYINARNSKTGSSGSGPNATSDGQGSGSSSSESSSSVNVGSTGTENCTCNNSSSNESSSESSSNNNSTSSNSSSSSNSGVSEISNFMFNKICKFETSHDFGYTMENKDLNGYDAKDSGGHLTFGYGLLTNPETSDYMDKIKKSWTQTELENLYKKDVAKRSSKVKKLCPSLSQNQFDSVVCACYNFGTSFIKDKKIGKMIQANPNDQAIYDVWVHLSDSQGTKYPGLIKRRQFEADYYFGKSSSSSSSSSDSSGSSSSSSSSSSSCACGNSNAWGDTPPGAYSPDASVTWYTPEQAVAANQSYLDEETAALKEALAAAGAEYAVLEANSNNYGDYTEEEIIEQEADIESLDDVPTAESSSPVANQEIQVGTTNASSSIDIMDQTNAEKNASDLTINTGVSTTEVQHTRIYEKIKPTIQLDEMTLDLEGKGGIIDGSTGLYDDIANNITNGPNPTTGSANATNITKNIGNVAPLIQINDAKFTGGDIIKFTLTTEQFVPTIMLELQTNNNNLIKQNAIKDGDICSVFIQPDNDMLKSYRGDFKITNTIMSQKDFAKNEGGIHIFIFGELFIPNLYNGSKTFSICGPSSKALEETAKKLGLGLNFCEDEDTNDSQIWYCISNGRQQDGGEPPVIKFMKKTILHAYKDKNSFYDGWIDPRYGLTFVNVNKLLGEDGLDEQVDLAFYNNAMTNIIAADNDNVDPNSSQKNKQMVPKIFTNIAADTASSTEFYVTSFKELNDDSVSNKIGLYTKQVYNIKNTGLNSSNNKVEFTSTLCINKTKLAHGFTILAGPGQNATYTQADNGNYSEQHVPVKGGSISHTQSDDDATNIVSSESNMSASGNTNKFYEIAPQHNMLNNLQLKKKQIQLVLNGKNMQIMRGEKIPVLLTNGTSNTTNVAATSGSNNNTLNQMYELGSGWFIISAINWKYDVTRKIGGTSWTTEVTLTRREWPIPGWIEEKEDETSEIEIQNNISDSNTVDNKSDNTSTTNDVTNSLADGSLPTTGLSDKLITLLGIMTKVAQTSGMTIKLVGARRWAADENGNRVDGAPYIQDGDSYKFVNAKNEVMWYSDIESAHLYGNAIDIINGEKTDYNKLIIKTLMKSNEVLVNMLTNGMYGANETSKDDTGNTVKHFHIEIAANGLYDKTQFWSWVKKSVVKSESITYNGKSYNIDEYTVLKTVSQAELANSLVGTNNTNVDSSTNGSSSSDNSENLSNGGSGDNNTPGGNKNTYQKGSWLWSVTNMYSMYCTTLFNGKYNQSGFAGEDKLTQAGVPSDKLDNFINGGKRKCRSDCSGFVCAALALYGVKVGGTSATLENNIPKATTKFKKIEWNKSLTDNNTNGTEIKVGTIFIDKGHHVTIWAGKSKGCWDFGNDRNYTNGQPDPANKLGSILTNTYEYALIPV